MRRSEAEIREAISLMVKSLDVTSEDGVADRAGVSEEEAAASRFFAATVIDVLSWVLYEKGPVSENSGSAQNATETLINRTRLIFDESLPNSN